MKGKILSTAVAVFRDERVKWPSACLSFLSGSCMQNLVSHPLHLKLEGNDQATSTPSETGRR